MANKKPQGRSNPQFMKPLQPDDALAAVVGSEPLPRTEVTKKIWDYIKEHNLQDPENKQMILADEKLRSVFGGKDKVSMFEMTRLVNKRLRSAERLSAGLHGDPITDYD